MMEMDTHSPHPPPPLPPKISRIELLFSNFDSTHINLSIVFTGLIAIAISSSISVFSAFIGFLLGIAVVLISFLSFCYYFILDTNQQSSTDDASSPQEHQQQPLHDFHTVDEEDCLDLSPRTNQEDGQNPGNNESSSSASSSSSNNSTPAGSVKPNRPRRGGITDGGLESCEWFNLVMAKVLREHFSSPKFKQQYVDKFTRLFNSANKPGYIGPIIISDFNFGLNSFQITDGVKLLTPSQEGELRGLCHIKYAGSQPGQVVVSTQLFLNWPREHFASIPVSLSVTMEHLSGQIVLVIPAGMNPQCTLSFTEEPFSKFSVGSLVGNKKKLKNIPKVSSYLIKKLQGLIKKDMVLPNGIAFNIPIKNERQINMILVRKLRERKLAEREKLKAANNGIAPPTIPTNGIAGPIPLQHQQQSHGIMSSMANKLHWSAYGSPAEDPHANNSHPTTIQASSVTTTTTTTTTTTNVSINQSVGNEPSSPNANRQRSGKASPLQLSMDIELLPSVETDHSGTTLDLRDSTDWKKGSFASEIDALIDGDDNSHPSNTGKEDGTTSHSDHNQQQQQQQPNGSGPPTPVKPVLSKQALQFSYSFDSAMNYSNVPKIETPHPNPAPKEEEEISPRRNASTGTIPPASPAHAVSLIQSIKETSSNTHGDQSTAKTPRRESWWKGHKNQPQNTNNNNNNNNNNLHPPPNTNINHNDPHDLGQDSHHNNNNNPNPQANTPAGKQSYYSYNKLWNLANSEKMWKGVSTVKKYMKRGVTMANDPNNPVHRELSDLHGGNPSNTRNSPRTKRNTSPLLAHGSSSGENPSSFLNTSKDSEDHHVPSSSSEEIPTGNSIRNKPSNGHLSPIEGEEDNTIDSEYEDEDEQDEMDLFGGEEKYLEEKYVFKGSSSNLSSGHSNHHKEDEDDELISPTGTKEELPLPAAFEDHIKNLKKDKSLQQLQQAEHSPLPPSPKSMASPSPKEMDTNTNNNNNNNNNDNDTHTKNDNYPPLTPPLSPRSSLSSNSTTSFPPTLSTATSTATTPSKPLSPLISASTSLQQTSSLSPSASLSPSPSPSSSPRGTIVPPVDRDSKPKEDLLEQQQHPLPLEHPPPVHRDSKPSVSLGDENHQDTPTQTAPIEEQSTTSTSPSSDDLVPPPVNRQNKPL